MERGNKVKRWKEEDMLEAIAACTTMSQRMAARTFNIPKSTLTDRLTGRVMPGAIRGPECMLSAEEEAKLAAYLLRCSSQGYGKTKEIILFMATAIAKKRRNVLKGSRLSSKWWMGFLRRNPHVSQNCGVVRTLVTRNTIECFYQSLLDTMANNHGGSLCKKPHLIFNCDESGFELDAINKIVAFARGSSHVPRRQREKVTVLTCATAAGNNLPSMFVYSNLSGRVPNGVQEDAPVGTFLTAQKSGWGDKDIYLKWFKELFLKSIPSERPALLLVDGRKSHVTEELIETAAANSILVFCLPANVSHLLQPLDLSPFGALKGGWVKACASSDYVTSAVVNQRNFAKTFNIAWNASITPDIIKSGFRLSGIYPFDPTAFDYSQVAPNVPTATEPPTMLTATASEPPPLAVPCTSTSSADLQNANPCPGTSASSPALGFNKLISLEKSIGRLERLNYRQRFANNYDVPGDTLYYSWKELYVAHGGSLDTLEGQCPCTSACCCTCACLGYCECLDCGVLKVKEHPTDQSPPKPRSDSNNTEGPNLISAPSGDIEIAGDSCSETMLALKRPATAGKRKRSLAK